MQSLSECSDSSFRGFLSAQPSSDRYDGTTDDPDNSAWKISTLIPKGARVLDVGCGPGSFAKLLQELRGCAVVGIEPDPDRARVATDRGIDVRCGYLTSELLSSLGSFDVVIFADVLEHVSNPSALVALAAKALRPGGAVIVSVPNVAHWSVRWNLLRGKFDYEPTGIMDVTHLRWFTEASIVRFFREIGYVVTDVDYTILLGLRVYSEWWPWKSLGQSRKRRLLRFLVRRLPKLFGCQIIIRASPSGDKVS